MTRYKLTPEEVTDVLVDSGRKWNVEAAPPNKYRALLYDQTGTVVTYRALGLDVNEAIGSLADYIMWMRNSDLEVL